MAEWLCSGLQSRVPRFDSGFRLQPHTGRFAPAPPDGLDTQMVTPLRSLKVKVTDLLHG